MADELWTVMSRLKDAEQTTQEFTDTKGDTNTIDEQTIIDRIFELIDVPEHEHDKVNNSTTTTRLRIDRGVVPCLVGTLIGTEDGLNNLSLQSYNVLLYPTGVPSELIEFTTGDPIEGVAIQLQIHGDTQIPQGTWTLATRITRTQIETKQTTTNGVPGPITQTETVTGSGTYMQVPVWL